MTTFLKSALTAAVLGTCATAASAGTIYAQSVSDGTNTCTVAVQNTDRTDMCNSLGAEDVDGSFSAGGFTSTANFVSGLTYTFGGFFTGPLTIWEVTGGGENNRSYIEQLSFTLFNSVTTAMQMGSVININGDGDGIDRWRIETAVAGTFDSLFVQDASDLSGGRDGFDIDAIAVSPVPLPASSLLLLAGLGAFGAMRRKKVAS